MACCVRRTFAPSLGPLASNRAIDDPSRLALSSEDLDERHTGLERSVTPRGRLI
jgi:hypothetical protein